MNYNQIHVFRGLIPHGMVKLMTRGDGRTKGILTYTPLDMNIITRHETTKHTNDTGCFIADFILKREIGKNQNRETQIKKQNINDYYYQYRCNCSVIQSRGGLALFGKPGMARLIGINHFMRHAAVNAGGFAGHETGLFMIKQEGDHLCDIIRRTDAARRVLLAVDVTVLRFFTGG